MTDRRDRDRRDKRLNGLYLGLVTRRDDPESLGRVKVLIPGLLEPESTWAWPLGSPGGGSAQRGTFEPPAVDSSVAVMFNQGEVDEPYYWTGPWGAPNGVSDIPTGAAVGEGSDLAARQIAVQEDGEWRLTRDSRTASGGKRWLLEHISSGLAVYLDGDADTLHLAREGATEALVRGTEYRAAEVAYLGALHTALSTFATAAKADTVATVTAAAALALETALGAITETDLRNSATAYLSDKAFTE